VDEIAFTVDISFS